VKAVRIHEDGGPEVLRYEDAPDPAPGEGEVLIELRAASLNHLDVWIRKGLPSVPKPRILGADGAGVVVSGDGFNAGDRVVINPGHELDNGRISVVGEHSDGTHAELIAVPSSQVYPLPDELDFETAAAFPLVFETAYRMLVTRAGLREGEWVLAWGIGSGVSTATLAIAKALGARVIVTSSSTEKLERARELGADGAFNHDTDDVVAKVKELTGGGAHVVVDHVGEATWKRTLDAARPLGRVCVCGATTGLRFDDGNDGGLRSRLRARQVGPCRSCRRRGVAARRSGRSARAPGSGPAARQDRAPYPRLGTYPMPRTPPDSRERRTGGEIGGPLGWAAPERRPLLPAKAPGDYGSTGHMPADLRRRRGRDLCRFVRIALCGTLTSSNAPLANGLYRKETAERLVKP